MAGYSGTPLPKKLGIKPGHRVAFVGAPTEPSEELAAAMSESAAADRLSGSGPFDVIVTFVDSQKALAKCFPAAATKLASDGGLWIAWPKKTSGIKTDLNENIIRDVGLAAGLVDNKVCAIDETWSGLRFVIRLRDRPKGKAR